MSAKEAGAPDWPDCALLRAACSTQSRGGSHSAFKGLAGCPYRMQSRLRMHPIHGRSSLHLAGFAESTAVETRGLPSTAHAPHSQRHEHTATAAPLKTARYFRSSAGAPRKGDPLYL